MVGTLDLNRNDRNNTFNMQFLKNKRPPAAKPERRLAAGLRPFNPPHRPFPRGPRKHLCKLLAINSVQPSSTQSNQAFGVEWRPLVATTSPCQTPHLNETIRHPIRHSSFITQNLCFICVHLWLKEAYHIVYRKSFGNFSILPTRQPKRPGIN